MNFNLDQTRGAPSFYDPAAGSRIRIVGQSQSQSQLSQTMPISIGPGLLSRQNPMTMSTPSLNFNAVPDGPRPQPRIPMMPNYRSMTALNSGQFSPGMSPMSPVVPPTPKLPLEELENIVENLQMSISSGNIEQAQICASQLAANATKIKMDLLESETIKEKVTFRLKVYVEYKNLSAGFVLLNVNPDINIKQLKEQMMLHHKIHTKLQKWIVGNKLCKDTDVLSSLGCKGDHAVFLYVMSARFAGLEKDKAERDQRRLSMGGLMPEASEEEGFVLVNRDEVPATAPRLEAWPEEPVENPAVRQRVVPQEPVQQSLPNNQPEIGQTVQKPALKWTCQVCTFENQPTRPGCEMCSTDRPDDFQIPDDYELTREEIQRKEAEELLDLQTQEAEHIRQLEHEHQRVINYHYLVEQEETLDLVANSEMFYCAICFDEVDPGEGVVLRECLHTFCRSCLQGTIENSEDAQVLCPFTDGNYSCDKPLQHREVQGLVSAVGFEKYLQRGLATAECQASNSYHCKTADCGGWCIYEDEVNVFNCPVCGKKNCLTCKAIHEGQNCKEYQDDLRIQADNSEAGKRSQEMLKGLVKSGQAMFCPGCQILIQKKEGCDWLRCTMCKIEICWCTRGPRWGTNGNGDVSGGCKCRVNGILCHPTCQNCH
ncbi:ranBP-type and C3HC4-type zinc finger-containing protein 1-like [Tubulanus polymorphus]|uniref:ranBP-type and C3HC4-type zinc finger-containing protein 1-like n=1 Tax=Tubulanus polymorphus TaxID=672921 RepID=UPI003DA31885